MFLPKDLNCRSSKVDFFFNAISIREWKTPDFKFMYSIFEHLVSI